jgi:hypothetical protein
MARVPASRSEGYACTVSVAESLQAALPSRLGPRMVDGSSPSEGFAEMPASRPHRFVESANDCHARALAGTFEVFALRSHGPASGLVEPFRWIRDLSARDERTIEGYSRPANSAQHRVDRPLSGLEATNFRGLA